MLHTSQCRTAEELELLVAQRRPAEQLEELYQHLRGCTRCAAIVDRLLPRATLAEMVRSQAGTVNTPLAAEKDSAPELQAPSAASDSAASQATIGSDTTTDTSFPEIPGYEIVGLLGHGGMGIVFRARQVRLGRLVALKIIKAGPHAAPQLHARFQIEAEALASLQHPNIVQIYDVGEHGGWPFFAMELVEGGALADRLGNKPQPPREAAQTVATLARAVHAAHQCGIVHRDLKPGNILVAAGPGGNEPATLKITDFGLAKRFEEDSQQTQTGLIMGTPSYMAPEQTTGQTRGIGPAADTYALGAILYEMLTGRPPFRGNSTLDTLQQVREMEPSPPSRFHPRLPRDLETICLKCLQKAPSRRYHTAEALADDLHRWLHLQPIHARPVTLWQRFTKWMRRRPAAAALIFVSVLAVVVLAAGGVWSHLALRAAAERAETQSRRAREVVNDMYTRVAEDWLADEPQQDPLQQFFLEKAMHLYEDFAKESAGDPQVRRELALAHFRLGQIYRSLNRQTEAESSYAKAIALQEQLCREFPSDRECRHNLAASYNWRGELRREGRRALAEAKDDFQKALQTQQKALESAPDDANLRRDLARSSYNLGIVALDSGAFAEALPNIDRAIAELSKLRQRLPNDEAICQELARGRVNRGVLLKGQERFAEAEAEYRQAIALLKPPEGKRLKAACRCDLAVAYQNLGNLLTAQTRHAAALTEFKHAVASLEQLSGDYPTRPGYRNKLANTCNSLATALARAGDRGAAQAAWERGRTLLEALTAEHPETPLYRRQLGMVLGNLGWLCTDRQDWAGARPHLEAAITELQAVAQKTPQDFETKSALRNQYQTLAETLVQLADHAGAAAAARELARVFPDQPQDSYHAACFLARTMPLIEGDKQLDATQRLARKQECATEVARWLQVAAAVTTKQVKRLPNEAVIFAAVADDPQVKKQLSALTPVPPP